MRISDWSSDVCSSDLSGGDAHELAVQAAEPTVTPTHVRVFEHRHAAQAFPAHGFGNEAHVARLDYLAFAASTQATRHNPCHTSHALVKRVEPDGPDGLRQEIGRGYSMAREELDG